MEHDQDRDFDHPLVVIFGNVIFDFGWVTVPGLFLKAYPDLGIDDPEAFLLVHLFAQKRDDVKRTFRLAELPMACSIRARKRYLHNLRERGLIFSRKVYSGYFPARVRCIELDLSNLLYNLYRWEVWDRSGRSGNFTVALHPLVAACIRADMTASGRDDRRYYHFVPDRWKEVACAMPIPKEMIEAAVQQKKKTPHAVSTNFGPYCDAVSTNFGPYCTVHGKEIGNREMEITTGPGPPDFSLVVAGSDAESHITDILTVLDRFVQRVAERWPTAEEEGQPLARALRKRYGVAPALLSSPVAPAAVAQATADLVEELWVLAQVLQDRGPVELCAAIDRALEREDKSPCRRLAVVWPRVPGALALKQELGRNRREGERLPGGYREARKLFILLNRFRVGLPLLDGFLGLCRDAGVRPVMDALQKALRDGREYVTLEFLRRSPEIAGSLEKSGPPPEGDAGSEPRPSDPAPVAGPGGPSLPPNGPVREWLSDYGIVEPTLSELQGADYALVRAWMLYLDAQERLSPEMRRAVLVRRLRAGDAPPGEWLRAARRLPMLDPTEEFMLEEACRQRRQDGRWPTGVLEVVGEEAAERWLEARRTLEKLRPAASGFSTSAGRPDERPIDFEKYTRGEYADLFGPQEDVT